MNEQQMRESKSRANKMLVAAFLIVGIEMGVLGSLSLYLEPLSVHAGITLTQAALLFSVNQVGSMAGSLMCTAWLDRIDPRIIMGIGAVGFFAFFACLYLANSVVWVIVAGLCLGVSQAVLGFSTTQPIITWWHATNVGTKISLMSVAMAAFGMVVAPAIAYGLDLFGYATTVLVNGLSCGIVMTLLVIFFIPSGKPEKFGLKPYGYEKVSQEAVVAAQSDAKALTFKQVLKTPPFWLVTIGSTLALSVGVGFLNNQALIYQSTGFDAVQAGLLISLFGAARTVWTFLYGFLSDKVGVHKMNVLAMSIGFVSVLAFIVIGGKVGAVIVAVFFCMVGGVTGMISSVSFNQLYGSESAGTLIPFSFVVNALGAIAATPIATAMYVSSGSFTSYMVLTAAVLVLVVVLLALAGSKKSQAKIDAMRGIEA